MLTVKAIAKSSKIQGLGLFANQKILKGTITWKFDPRFDILFSPEEVNKMSQDKKDLIVRYAYLSKISGKYVYSIDDSRFTNHSVHNNVDLIVCPGEPEHREMANRDIEKGEEILINYRLFDTADEKSTEEYLNG